VKKYIKTIVNALKTWVVETQKSLREEIIADLTNKNAGEEYDLDIDITVLFDANGQMLEPTYTVNTLNSFENIKNKIHNKDIVKSIASVTFFPVYNDSTIYSQERTEMYTAYCSENMMGGGVPECLFFNVDAFPDGFNLILTSDNVIQIIGTA
jgi:hypothetical protein